MRKKGQCLSSTHTSMVRSVGPSPNMNTATIVAVSFVFLVFSPPTLLLWNADALIKSQNCFIIKSVRWWTFLFIPAPLMLCCYHKCLPKDRKKSNLPMGVIIGTLSNGNKLRTLAELIILNDMLLAAH